MCCFWRRQWLKILFRSRCDNTTCHQQLIWWQALITIKFVFVIFSGTLLANVDFTKGLVCRNLKGIVTINIWDKKQHDHTIVLVGCLCEMHNNDGLIFLHFSVGTSIVHSENPESVGREHNTEEIKCLFSYLTFSSFSGLITLKHQCLVLDEENCSL